MEERLLRFQQDLGVAIWRFQFARVKIPLVEGFRVRRLPKFICLVFEDQAVE